MSEISDPPIETNTLTDQTYEFLRSAIVRGVLKPGEVLNQGRTMLCSHLSEAQRAMVSISLS